MNGLKLSLALFSMLLIIACSSSTDSDTSSSDTSSESLNQDGVVQFDKTGFESPHVEVTVTGYTEGKVYLIGTFEDQNFVVDSTQVDRDGHFVFQRSEPYDPGLYYLYMPDQSTLQILLDKDQTFELTSNKGDYVFSTAVAGQVDTELLYHGFRYEAELQPRFDEIRQKLQGLQPGDPVYEQIVEDNQGIAEERKAHFDDLFSKHPNALWTQYKRSGQNPDPVDVRNPDGTLDAPRQLIIYRQQFWDNVDFSDYRLLRTPVIANKLKRYITELVPQSADSIIKVSNALIDRVEEHPPYFKFFANWVGVNYEPGRAEIMDADAIFVNQVKNYFTYDKAFWADSASIYSLQLRAAEMQNSLVGQKGPNVTSTDLNGQKQSIYDIEDPYIVVFLYNPTCDHCREQVPVLVDLYNNWNGPGLEVYAIAIETTDDEWRTYVAEAKMPWINVFDPTNESIYKTYYVDKTPEVYVLNRDRTIVAKNINVNQIAEVISREEAEVSLQ